MTRHELEYEFKCNPDPGCWRSHLRQPVWHFSLWFISQNQNLQPRNQSHRQHAGLRNFPAETNRVFLRAEENIAFIGVIQLPTVAERRLSGLMRLVSTIKTESRFGRHPGLKTRSFLDLYRPTRSEWERGEARRRSRSLTLRFTTVLMRKVQSMQLA